MNLDLDDSHAAGYTSPSQWARRVTEPWAAGNLYCIACTADSLAAHAANRAVEDFHCLQCGRRLQLKAKNGRLGASISNSAYGKKVEAIAAGRVPDYCFMAYDKDALRVTDVMVVPGHFVSLSVISARTALRQSAERSGWVGSVIHLDRVPQAGKISVVSAGRPRPKPEVRANFAKLAFVGAVEPSRRGWLTDVLGCLDRMEIRPGSEFTNEDIYGFEEHLAQLHPGNRNVRPKIRQQLQVLAANRFVRRLSPGRYARL